MQCSLLLTGSGLDVPCMIPERYFLPWLICVFLFMIMQEQILVSSLKNINWRSRSCIVRCWIFKRSTSNIPYVLVQFVISTLLPNPIQCKVCYSWRFLGHHYFRPKFFKFYLQLLLFDGSNLFLSFHTRFVSKIITYP